MDRHCRLVTATDGQARRGLAETQGNFYLLERSTGQLLWQFHTQKMNWPMAISADGSAIFAASDTGQAFYWAQQFLR